MEIAGIKAFLKTYRRPVTCIRILLVYLTFLLLATNTTIFDYGITKGKLNIFVSAVVIFYRFLSIAVVPGILVLWMLEASSKLKKQI